MDKKTILSNALEQRSAEILGYQIDIDNYELALKKIAAEHAGESPLDSAMRDFAGHLEKLLFSSRVEQRKAQIILEVIKQQVEV